MSSIRNRKIHRKIHIDLPVEVHRKLRVKAAVEDVSMQAFVARLVSRSVEHVSLPERSAATRTTTGQDLLDSGLVGIWKKRRDIGESLEFAWKLRTRAQDRVGRANLAKAKRILRRAGKGLPPLPGDAL